MDKFLTWSLLAPVAGYWFLRLSHLRYTVGLQSGYSLLFLSLLTGIVSMIVVAVGFGVYQGKELTIEGLLPATDAEFLRIWMVDIAVITLWGSGYWIWNRFKSEEAITERRLKIAEEYGEKIVCFLGESMMSKTPVQVSMGDDKEYVGYVSAIPTPLPMWGFWGVNKEVSILAVREEDTPVIHIPLDKIESVGTLPPDDAAHDLGGDN